MKKLKSLDGSAVFNIIKACLFGVLITLVGIIVLAVVLKFTDLPINVVNYINDAIKVISLFAVVLIIKKHDGNKLLLKALFASLVYAILSFVIFSILNGGFVLDLSVLYDLIFAVVATMLVAIIVNLTFRKSE